MTWLIIFALVGAGFGLFWWAEIHPRRCTYCRYMRRGPS